MNTNNCKIGNIRPAILMVKNEKQQKHQNWNEKLKNWNEKLKEFGKASSYAIHRQYQKINKNENKN